MMPNKSGVLDESDSVLNETRDKGLSRVRSVLAV